MVLVFQFEALFMLKLIYFALESHLAFTAWKEPQIEKLTPLLLLQLFELMKWKWSYFFDSRHFSGKKSWPDFEGLPGASRWIPHHETGPKNFFCPKTTKYHQDSHVKGPAQFQTVNRSWVVFYPFWPAVPKPLTLGALSKGHPKYLFGATKWPPKHYGGASLTDPVAMGKITT